MTTEAQTGANRANAQKSTGLCVRSDRVSGIGVRDVTPAPSAPVPWASAPNKPNLGHSKTKGKWFAGKELWLSGPAKSTGKTKPNLGASGVSGGGRRAGGAYCATTPRCPVSFRQQSQFRPDRRKWAWAAGSNVRNKANLLRGMEDHRQGLRPSRCHPSPGQMRKTNQKGANR